jgi:hypothetical protein
MPELIDIFGKYLITILYKHRIRQINPKYSKFIRSLTLKTLNKFHLLRPHHHTPRNPNSVPHHRDLICWPYYQPKKNREESKTIKNKDTKP